MLESSQNLTVRQGMCHRCLLKTVKQGQEQAAQRGHAVAIHKGAQDPTGQSPEVMTSTSAQAVIALGLGFMLMNENYQSPFLNLCAVLTLRTFLHTVSCCSSTFMTLQTSVPVLDTAMLFLHSLASQIFNILKMKGRSSTHSSFVTPYVR